MVKIVFWDAEVHMFRNEKGMRSIRWGDGRKRSVENKRVWSQGREWERVICERR